LTAEGLSVLLLHHPRKGAALAGQAARGSGVLASHVDILIEMNWYAHPDDDGDRRRWLRAYSRHDETRRQLIVELTAAGDDYLAHDTLPDKAWVDNWVALRLVLEDADERLTQRQILEQWPEDFRKPDKATISRGLTRGVEQRLILQQGTGRKNDPYHYWLPGKEEDFYPGHNASPEQLQRWQRRYQQRFFERLGISLSAKPETTAAAGNAEGGESATSTTRPVASEPPVAARRPDAAAPPRRAGEPNLSTAASPPASLPTPAPATSSPPTPPAAPKPPTPEELVAAERRRLRRWPYG
jgi:hypothetical protein